MAEETQGSNWSVPKFYFKVDFGNETVIFFQEFSGLDGGVQPKDDSQTNTWGFTTTQMPGVDKNASLILKHGSFSKENRFLDWYNSLERNTIGRQNVIIQLCDEHGIPLMTWTLHNAWPTKISLLDLKSDTNEVVVESIEICHEGLFLSRG